MTSAPTSLSQVSPAIIGTAMSAAQGLGSIINSPGKTASAIANPISNAANSIYSGAKAGLMGAYNSLTSGTGGASQLTVPHVVPAGPNTGPFASAFQSFAPQAPTPAPATPALTPGAPQPGFSSPMVPPATHKQTPGPYSNNLGQAIVQASADLQVDPVDLGSIIGFETAGSFDPWQKGPVTKWGQQQGLIQWGQPQAAQYGLTPGVTPVGQQMAAVVQYAKDRGFVPGKSTALNLYAAINAGNANKTGARDAAQGGTWGTVKDKFDKQIPAFRGAAQHLISGATATNDWQAMAQANMATAAGIQGGTPPSPDTKIATANPAGAAGAFHMTSTLPGKDVTLQMAQGTPPAQKITPVAATNPNRPYVGNLTGAGRPGMIASNSPPPAYVGSLTGAGRPTVVAPNSPTGGAGALIANAAPTTPPAPIMASASSAPVRTTLGGPQMAQGSPTQRGRANTAGFLGDHYGASQARDSATQHLATFVQRGRETISANPKYKAIETRFLSSNDMRLLEGLPLEVRLEFLRSLGEQGDTNVG